MVEGAAPQVGRRPRHHRGGVPGRGRHRRRRLGAVDGRRGRHRGGAGRRRAVPDPVRGRDPEGVGDAGERLEAPLGREGVGPLGGLGHCADVRGDLVVAEPGAAARRAGPRHGDRAGAGRRRDPAGRRERWDLGLVGSLGLDRRPSRSFRGLDARTCSGSRGPARRRRWTARRRWSPPWPARPRRRRGDDLYRGSGAPVVGRRRPVDGHGAGAGRWTTSSRGALGAPTAVTGPNGADSAPHPNALRTETVYVYPVRGVRPATVPLGMSSS